LSKSGSDVHSRGWSIPSGPLRGAQVESQLEVDLAEDHDVGAEKVEAALQAGFIARA